MFVVAPTILDAAHDIDQDPETVPFLLMLAEQ